MIRRKRGIFSVINARATCLLSLFLLCGGTSQAQALMGARLSGLAGAVTAIPDDSWQVFGNPAMIPVDKTTFSVYTRRNYNLAELTDYAGTFTWNHDNLTLGGGANSFGNDRYRQTRFLIAGMRRFKFLRVGLRVSYTRISLAPPYGSAGQFGIDAGFGIRALPHLWIGAFATNINSPKLGKALEPLPQTLDIGLSWMPASKVFIATGIHKDIRFPVSVRSGIEWHPVSVFALRVGVTTKPTTYTIGSGIGIGRLSANIVAQHHQWLGWSPGIDIGLNL